MSLMFVYGRYLWIRHLDVPIPFTMSCAFYQFDFYLWMLEFILGFPIVFTESVSRVSPCLWRSDFLFYTIKVSARRLGLKTRTYRWWPFLLSLFFFYHQHQITHHRRL